jgi:CCR4-NOT transcription complex subunit 4
LLLSFKILSQKEYFGQYGKITRLVVNNTKAYAGTNIPSYSAYVTYSTIQEAALAILAIDYTMHDDLLIRASFGSTKYCSHFLRNVECTNKDCLYYHYFVDEKDIINNKVKD